MADMYEITERAKTLFRVRKTCLKMLMNRKYIVSEEELNMSFDTFKELVGFPDIEDNMLTIMVVADDNPDEKLFVFFPASEKKIGIKQIRQYVKRMESKEVGRAIIVVREKMTPLARSTLMEMGPRFIMEHFTESELLVDITEHELVPKHTVLTEEEKQFLLTQYKLRESQLPRMQVEDPIARYYGMKRGDVVKIERDSETSGRYITYRICLN